jgi:primary-amine oxidase
MSLEQVLPTMGATKAKLTLQHPIAPLTAAEITESSGLIKASWPSNTNLQFKAITLQEPTKAELVPYLAAEHSGQKLPQIARRSFVVYYIRNTVSCNA